MSYNTIFISNILKLYQYKYFFFLLCNIYVQMYIKYVFKNFLYFFNFLLPYNIINEMKCVYKFLFLTRLFVYLQKPREKIIKKRFMLKISRQFVGNINQSLLRYNIQNSFRFYLLFLLILK